MEKGLFIVFEGIDGSGSSTQASLLKDYFLKQGRKAVLSPEPSEGIIGKLIRETLKGRILFTEEQEKLDEQLAYLFAADRHDHLYNQFDGVFKLITKGFQVITTRYYFSSLAYNSNTPEDFAFISSLNAKFPAPDLLVYIDIPVEVALERLSQRSSQEIYENRQKLVKVRENYQSIFAQYEETILRVDGTKEQNLIHEEIVDFVNWKLTVI